MKSRLFVKVAFPILLAALAACAQPAAYAPRAPGQQTGYTDRQLGANRYRVTFTGNSVTPRETVENYLLLRAAEVSLAAGYDHFLFDSRDTRAQTHYDAIPTNDPYFARGFYGPRFYGPGYFQFRPRFGYDPFGPPVDIIVSTRFSAYAEIVGLNADQAAKEPRAVDARSVIAHLGPAAQPVQADFVISPAH